MPVPPLQHAPQAARASRVNAGNDKDAGPTLSTRGHQICRTGARPGDGTRVTRPGLEIKAADGFGDAHGLVLAFRLDGDLANELQPTGHFAHLDQL